MAPLILVGYGRRSSQIADVPPSGPGESGLAARLAASENVQKTDSPILRGRLQLSRPLENPRNRPDPDPGT